MATRYMPDSRQHTRRPNERALHLRYVDLELYQRIRAAARYRNQTLTKWVADVLKLYLDGAATRYSYSGMCEVCKKRAVLSAPVKKGKTKMKPEAEGKMEGETQEAEGKLCRHALQRHPGCMKADFSGHAHGDWWPRSECEIPECRNPGNTRLEKLRDKMISETPRL